MPAGAKRMDANRGIEAIALIRAGRLKGTLVAFSERLPDKSGNLTGWLIGGPTPGTIALKPIEGFDITDAAALPDGGIVILERRFRYSEGIKMRIRRVSAAELKPGAVIRARCCSRRPTISISTTWKRSACIAAPPARPSSR